MVLADLIAEIQNSRHGQPHITVFKLSDLRKEYCKRLIREGLAEETQEIHSTRLKEKLIEAIPGFKTAHSKGRELGVVSFYRRYIGTIVSDAFSNDNDANEMCLQRAASILREEMFTESYVVNGSFSQNCQRGSIPQTLLSLVNMILEGPKAKYQSTIKPGQAALSLPPLLKFNGVKHTRNYKLRQKNVLGMSKVKRLHYQCTLV